MKRSLAQPELLFQQACGVLAERLEVDPQTAGQILGRVARREGITEDELAATVVSSCTQTAYLPRDLYAYGHGHESVA
jgi:ANTAR domain-containing protein